MSNYRSADIWRDVKFSKKKSTIICVEQINKHRDSIWLVYILSYSFRECKRSSDFIFQQSSSHRPLSFLVPRERLSGVSR